MACARTGAAEAPSTHRQNTPTTSLPIDCIVITASRRLGVAQDFPPESGSPAIWRGQTSRPAPRASTQVNSAATAQRGRGKFFRLLKDDVVKVFSGVVKLPFLGAPSQGHRIRTVQTSC